MTKTIYFLALGLISANAMAQTQIYGEDFQNGLPASYTIVDNDGFTPDASVANFANAWISLVDPTNPSDSIVGSTSFFNPVGQADRWLITPPIVLGAYGNSMFWDAKSHDPSFPDGYMVLASRTDVTLASFTDTIYWITSESADWTYREANLSEIGLDNETIHIAFVNRTNNGFKLYLDSISVFKEDPAGLNNIEPFLVGIHPNPTNGKVTIKGEFDLARIYSTAGQLIIETSNDLIDLSNYDSGVYLISVQNGDRIYRTKIVKAD